MKQELVITNKADLLKLQGRGRKYSRIELNVPHFAKEENERWAKLVQKEYKACGCNTGSYFIMAAILFSLAYFLLNMTVVIDNIGYYLVRLLGLAVIMGLIGKASGLIAAHRKLHLLIGILKRKI
ncbi:MAG: hypothetical protein J7621_12880 [Niastella sp.]|nr:hypothetical protein [Niastella sp.]